MSFCRSWSAGVGPVKDAYNIGENPQFRLEVEASAGAVWVLLTRHITQIDDFRENTEYITVLVYKNDGNRVYYPSRFYLLPVQDGKDLYYILKLMLIKLNKVLTITTTIQDSQ